MTRSDRSYKVKIIVYLLIFFALMLCMIGITAHNSKIQYEINSMNTQISETQREIQNLQVQIKSAANITNLESRALALGLTYPEYDQIVYLDWKTGEGIEDFALALKESAYR
jgi:cell division protein FtsL